MIATPVVVGLPLILICPSDWKSASPPETIATGAAPNVKPKLSVAVVFAARVPEPPLMTKVLLPTPRWTSNELVPKVPEVAATDPMRVLRADASPHATTDRPNDVKSAVDHASEPV